jgi:carbon-monoxide dehydrogenase small subunit
MLPSLNISFTLNGELRQDSAPPEMCVTDFLREELGLTGTKFDCAEGECGACTVIFNGEPACSCLMTVGQLDGADVRTVEGMAPGSGVHHAVQRAFVSEGAVQCGHCIPGMIVSGVALLERNPSPTEAEIRYAIAGNICRCTGYAKIVSAIAEAAEILASERTPAAAGS